MPAQGNASLGLGNMSNSIQLYQVTSDGAHELPLQHPAKQVHEVLDGLQTGVYTGMRTFEGRRFLGLGEHLDRLESSMAQMGYPLPLERGELRRALDQVVSRFAASGEDSFLRVDVLPPGVEWPGGSSRILITRGPLTRVPLEFQQRGVEVAIAEDLRRRSPGIKTADFVLARRPYPIGTRDCYEHLMVDEEGYLLEATSSNFYGVLRGEIRTASAAVLAGITRRFLLFLCAGLEYHVNTSAIHRSELPELEEAFLTSSTRGIVPVVAVDGITLGDGTPGPKTRALMGAYDVLTQRSAQPAWPPTA